MINANNSRLIVTRTILWTIVGVATAVMAYRYAFGLGASTALTDRTPWGMWIGFDVLSGVALAAGGFVIAATVHIFHLERYEALVRPAILTAFLGYVAVVFGLLVDLGRPWNIWRMIVNWNPDSPLFEVGWCVMLYSAVLALEFAPVAFEGLRLERPRRILRRVTLPLVITGIALSTLHQSSLGTLFLLTPDRMHPLWYTPLISLQFLVSAVALGLVMVTTESLVTSWIYRKDAEWRLLPGLTRAAAVAMGLYLALRVGDLAWRGQLRHVVEGSWASFLFMVELLISTVIPILLFTLPSLRRRRGALATGAMLGVAGFILHRAAVGGLSHIPITGEFYVPALTELVVSLGIVSIMALIFLFAIDRLPVWEEAPPLPEHFTAPMQDPVTRTYFGQPWFGRVQLAALGWTGGIVLGAILLETTVGDWLQPRPQPIQMVRSVMVESTKRDFAPGHRMVLRTARDPVAEPAADVVPALLIDGDRSGTWVVFQHDAHKERLGGVNSCGQCHHRNLALEQGSSCVKCHRDMYRLTDTFAHDRHVTALGRNDSCVRCHADSTLPKTRTASKACQDCHKAEVSPNTRVVKTLELEPGLAVGYRAAMHGLCVTCHKSHETQEAVEDPFLSRCTACHRNFSGEGEELRLREGWTQATTMKR